MAITVTHLSKRFLLYERPWRRFQEWMTLGRKQYHTPFWALRDVNLHVAAGTAVGIVGPNGAGKSTLLKIISGTLFPTEGEVTVEGRVAGLLELGTGFHPEFTGRLNIYLNGKMLGLSDDEIAERFPEIVRFSELGDFIEQPVRTYSTGMVMRLGFAVASCVDPDILIIDEVLSVGDAYFSQKCVRRIREFREKGVTILFVSHDPSAVLTLCDQAVLLENGVVLRSGAPDEILDFYNARTAERSSRGDMHILAHSRDAGALRSGNFRAVIAGVGLQNRKGNAGTVFAAGESVSLGVRVLFLEEIENPTVGILIRNRLGIEVFGVNTHGLGRSLGRFLPGETAEVSFDFDLNLAPGDYSLTVAAHLDETHLAACFDWIDKACLFRVLPSSDFAFYGLAKLAPALSVAHRTETEGETDRVLRSLFGDAPESLDETAACDRFFLEGWSVELGGEASARHRRLDGRGRFVYRPAGRFLKILPEPAPARPQTAVSGAGMRLSWIGGAAEAVFSDSDGAVFSLPETEIGKTQMFTLEALSSEGGEIAVVRVQGIQSVVPGGADSDHFASGKQP